MTRHFDWQDELEIGRKAHELSVAHGPHAYRYAAKVAERALAEGDTEGHELWDRVAATLRPRQNSN